jgi:hypothetical protein
MTRNKLLVNNMEVHMLEKSYPNPMSTGSRKEDHIAASDCVCAHVCGRKGDRGLDFRGEDRMDNFFLACQVHLIGQVIDILLGMSYLKGLVFGIISPCFSSS